MNPGSLMTAALLGFGAFAATKFLGNLIAKGIAKLSGGTTSVAVTPTAAALAPDGSTTTAQTVTTTTTPAPASGFGAIPDSVANPIGALLAGGLTIFAASKLVQDQETREGLVVGATVSILHTITMGLLNAVAPTASAMLAGNDMAVKLAAMYGLNGGTSIMPRYQPIGEYFSSGVNGLGALPPYAAQAGLGEYFESGVEGLGNYVGNTDIQQAAAGYGADDTSNSNHIDPSSDLDRELTIAEAAAGIGNAGYQAAAGMRGMRGVRGVGEYYAANGLGAVSTVQSSNTWIPGMSDAQIWAGTRSIDQGQEATAMIPAGVLSSGGDAGVFG